MSIVGDFAFVDRDPEAQRIFRELQAMYWRLPVVAEHIIGAALGWSRLSEFQRDNEVKESRQYSSVEVPGVLAGKRIESYDTYEIGLDHTTLWQQGGKPKLLVTQPYQISKDQLKKLIEHCDQYGIDFSIDARSFYFPGSTIRIVFKKER